MQLDPAAPLGENPENALVSFSDFRGCASWVCHPAHCEMCQLDPAGSSWCVTQLSVSQLGRIFRSTSKMRPASSSRVNGVWSIPLVCRGILAKMHHGDAKMPGCAGSSKFENQRALASRPPLATRV